jgi:hypothetical protein
MLIFWRKKDNMKKGETKRQITWRKEKSTYRASTGRDRLAASLSALCVCVCVCVRVYVIVDSRQQTADSRQQTADSRQQTVESRQQTADRADSRQQTVPVASSSAEMAVRVYLTVVSTKRFSGPSNRASATL